MKRNESLVVKITVPLLIVAVVVALWFVKNGTTEPEPTIKLEGADFNLDVTTEIDFAALAEYGLPVIADYGSDSCIPCKQMAPVLKTLNAEMKGKAFVKFVDVWKYYEATGNVPVQVIPTQVFINADGTPFVPSPELAKEIQFDMYDDKDTGKHAFTIHQGGLTEEQMRAILAEMGVE